MSPVMLSPSVQLGVMAAVKWRSFKNKTSKTNPVQSCGNMLKIFGVGRSELG